jgi:hypothetical protein
MRGRGTLGTINVANIVLHSFLLIVHFASILERLRPTTCWQTSRKGARIATMSSSSELVRAMRDIPIELVKEELVLVFISVN